ncbi:MAG TPA: flagellar hook-basal body complex protein FliE [Thermoplasmatales archaeon]|nr:flagellar hook-basal body complex protein FliE [Thermoplasmatales archaeon]
MKAIAFTGMPGSGKSEAVKVAKEMGIPVIRMGDCVWEEVRKRGLKLNDENVGKIANEMREKYGKDIWAKRTLEKIKPSWSKVVIDGVRNIEEVDYFRKNLGKDFLLIAIHASPITRYKRLMERGREDDSTNLDKIKERDERELRWGIGVLIALADVIIVNENSLDEFRRDVEKILRE